MTTGYTAHDEHVVDLFLLEADPEGAEELKAALLELRSFAAGQPIAPSAKLAALMDTGPASLDARRQRKHRRAALAALAVAASMGIGTAAVAAADPGFRAKAQETITTVIDTLTRGHSGRTTPAPRPASPQAPAHTPDHPTPARNVPGRSGQENPSPATGAGNPGHEDRPTLTPPTPAETTPGKGTANGPSGLDHQNTPNRTQPATPYTGSRS